MKKATSTDPCAFRWIIEATVLSMTFTAITVPTTEPAPMMGTVTACASAESPTTMNACPVLPSRAARMSGESARVSARAEGSSLLARRTPSASVICTQSASSWDAASCDWSSTSPSFFSCTSARKFGFCTKTSAPPRNARERAER